MYIYLTYTRHFITINSCFYQIKHTFIYTTQLDHAFISHFVHCVTGLTCTWYIVIDDVLQINKWFN